MNMEEKHEFRPGLYQHYKGGLYTALMLVMHHETRQPMVLYISHSNASINVRPLNSVEGDPDGWKTWVEVKNLGTGRMEYLERFEYKGGFFSYLRKISWALYHLSKNALSILRAR
jgi:hypothetical protein